MDIKSMLVKLAEEQADKMQEEALKHLASDEFTKNLSESNVSNHISKFSFLHFIL